MMRIPVNMPMLNGNEKKYLMECIDTAWISSEGPFVRKLESDLSAYVGRKYGIAVCNGSAALDIAVKALGLNDGDEVIMPAFTIISCAAAIVRAGAIPVLVDSDPETWNMDVNKIESRITPRTKAIMVVHIYGLPVDMDPVLDIAHRYGLKIIEDAAEMHGQTYNGRRCGSFGDVSIFSFYPNKHITTGEGGLIVTDDESIFERCQSFRNLCFRKKGRRFIHDELGWNCRMSNVQAAIGVAQFERLEEHIRLKREIGRRYTELLSNVSGIKLPVSKTEYADNIYWVYGIVLDDPGFQDADVVMSRLSEKGVECRPFFWPMNKQPVFMRKGLFKGEDYPCAEYIAERGFYIPSGLGVTEDQMVYVANAVKDLLQ